LCITGVGTAGTASVGAFTEVVVVVVVDTDVLLEEEDEEGEEVKDEDEDEDEDGDEEEEEEGFLVDVEADDEEAVVFDAEEDVVGDLSGAVGVLGVVAFPATNDFVDG